MVKNLKKANPSVVLAADSNLAPSKDTGHQSDAMSCISSAGDATSSIKGSEVDHDSLTTDQGGSYSTSSYYGYYYPGYDGSYGELDNQGYYVGGDGSEFQYPVMQADNGSFAYFMPGFQPSYAPYLPVTTIGVDGQYVDQQAYLSSPMFQPPVASPGYYAPNFPYGELLPSPYMWDPSLRVGDGAFGNSYAGFPEFSDPKSNLSTPSHTRAPLSKGYSEFSSPLGINSSLPSLDISSGHGMRKQLKPVNKFSAQNQGKGALLYSNNLVNLKANVTGWGSTEKMKSRSKINGVTTIGSLNEQNQGPRTANAKGALLSGGNAAGPLATDGNGNSNSITSLIRTDQYNLPDFPTKYDHAFFFVIKSYSEDDIHKSIKYNVWASTPNGNKRLDGVYQDAQEKMAEKGSKCPVFLFFSVNASGQFCGVAEMIGRVDFNKSMDFWQQDKWNGYFPVKWHIIKDVPNPHLRHIILENNDNKPVTNSRDTQEVRFPQGLEMLNIFKNHVSKTSILDDFDFYESRERVMQEKRMRQSVPLFSLQKIDELNTSFKSIDLSAVKSIEQPEVGDKVKK
nr:uncharacterized protein LOC112037317 isoform X2 [Quercus suber]POE93877.1 isoform 2 of yth domain-containing family protein 2 [Quercus suber]